MAIKRVAAYIKRIDIQEGLVSMLRNGSSTNLKANINKDWDHSINANILQPKDTISLMAAGKVRVRMYTRDQESGEFFNLGETIVSDRLTHIRVRQFIVSDVYHINKSTTKEGIVLADLEF